MFFLLYGYVHCLIHSFQMSWKLILSEDTLLEPKWDIPLTKTTPETTELMPLRLCMFQLRSIILDLRNTVLKSPVYCKLLQESFKYVFVMVRVTLSITYLTHTNFISDINVSAGFTSGKICLENGFRLHFKIHQPLK